jgi:Pectate lyase superfamily protein
MTPRRTIICIRLRVRIAVLSALPMHRTTPAIFVAILSILTTGQASASTSAKLIAQDNRIRAAVANVPGAVVVRFASGKVRSFPAVSNLDTARGAALDAVFRLGTTLRNSTVFLGPGTFTITSPLRGFSGTKLYGSGRNATLIKMADGSVDFGYFVFRCVEAADPKTGYRYASNCELRDLTVDVNRQNQLPGQFFGVGAQIMASNAVISHVTCRNAGGNTSEELFCVSIVAAGGASGTFNTGLVRNALIEHCEVTSVAPGFNTIPIAITPIAINGSWTPNPVTPSDGWIVGGRITDCAVHGIVSGAGLLSFQVSAASRVSVENCATYDNHSRFINGFYTDTGSIDRVRISRNRFADVDVGIRLLCDSASFHQGTLIFANDIQFRTVDGIGVGKAGVEYSGNSRTSGFRVLNNRMALSPSIAGATGVNLNRAAGGVILDNVIDGFPIPVGLQFSDDAIVSRNTDAAGVPVAVGVGNPLP